MLLNERSIVIAEDNAVLRCVLTEIFREYGWRVRSAQDGFSALETLTMELPAVLLSDLEMSGMSGFELLSIVRRRFPSIRVVAMSGAFTGSVVPAGVAADAFYAKGGSIASLLDIVADVRNSQVQSTRGQGVPLWISSSPGALSLNEAHGVACSHCMRVIHLPFPYLIPEAQLTCPYCRQQVTVFLLQAPATGQDHGQLAAAQVENKSSFAPSNESGSAGLS